MLKHTLCSIGIGVNLVMMAVHLVSGNMFGLACSGIGLVGCSIVVLDLLIYLGDC
jgi:hypothetical protein